MPESCAAANCKQSTDQSNVFFFRFPLDTVRCQQWVSNSSRPDLATKTPEYLHKNFMLCSKHFDKSMICQKSAVKAVLKDNAVPTIFDFGTNQDKAENSSRKRTREKSADEPVVTKKPKGTTEISQPSVIEAEAPNDPGENSETQNLPAPDESEEEDPAVSKVKETLKDYFKETLAFTGFSIGNNAIPNSAKPLGSDPTGPLPVNTICAEKIDRKEVLSLGEDVMHEEIGNSLRLARFFSILLQDKINIEGKDQIPLFIRYVTSAGYPQKHLMGFLPCDVDSDTLFNMLISEICNKWSLRMEHCRGFTFLSSGTVCQKLKELTCRMLRDYPQVVLAPSEPYAFNMWLIRSMPILSIQDVVDTVEQVATVIRESETLARKLEVKITSSYGHIKGEVDRVKESCQNHWEYSTDAFQTMLDILEPLLNSIAEMCTSSLSNVDADTVEVLLKLKDRLKNFDFIVTLVVLKNTLCCVSILNPSLRGIISISSTLQYTISNALKLLNKYMQEIAIFHRKWFSDALGRAKKLSVPVSIPAELATNGEGEEKPQISLEDYYRESLSKKVLQYLLDEVKRVLGIEMVRILRWLSLVPSYMADHNFSIRKDKVADANLNNLARPDSFYDELGCWEVKWRHASKRRILPTNVFATLKIPDIGFYPNIQSLLRVLGTIPCVTAEPDVYGQYEMVLNRYHSYMKEVPVDKRLCNMAFVYVNQDVHFSIEEMVEAYITKHPEILQLLKEDDVMEVQPSVPDTSANDASKEDMEESREMTLNMEVERQKPPECAETDKEALKSALRAAVTAACNRQGKHTQGDQEVEYVTKSEMNEVLKVCENVVRDRILAEVRCSFFSLFIDRVVRFGETDYLPMFLRFVDSFDVMRLELLGFVEVSYDTDTMCERLLDAVTKEWRLDLSYCRGQAYLGNGEVSYKLKAFACKVQEKQPLAICTHFSCYSFNTWWSRSVPVAAVIRAIDTLEEIVSFFRSDPFFEKQLDQVLAIGLRESYEKIHELQGNFCSSWLEKHDSYEVFAQILEPLAMCLENIDDCKPQGWTLAVSNQAKRLLQLIRDFDFIVAIVALKNASSFTRELSAALQKDHFSAASQLCQISGIVATLNRVKTNIKVFHQNWFDEACTFAQNLGVQVKVPDSVVVPRDSLLKPGTYYKDTMSVPLVDHLINMVKDYFSDDHKEALNFLSLVPCSVTMSYVFETLKSKPPLYIGDLPDPDNFFTELSCWKVKWKTKVVNITIPETIFQTLRLPLMQYFANINTLLKILCVLPSTALEYCGEVKRHKMYQDYVNNTSPKDRSPCLAMLQVGTDFNRDLDKMVTQCLKVTPKTLEGICLDKESKTLGRATEIKTEDDNHMEEVENRETNQDDSRTQVMNSETQVMNSETQVMNSETQVMNSETQVMNSETQVMNSETTNKADIPEEAESVITQDQSENISEAVAVEQPAITEEQERNMDKNGHSEEPVDNIPNCEKVFKQAAVLARRNCSFNDLSKWEQDSILQDLASCHWALEERMSFSEGEMLQCIVKAIREQILSEVQDSPFFSIITDRAISVDEAKFLPVFIRYVNDCIPKVELIGFLPFDESSDVNLQAKALASTLEADWGLQMGYCRGQSIMCIGTKSQSLRKMALGFLESYPLAVNTPSESCGLAYWLALSLQNSSITKVLEIAEDLLQFFDQSPKLENELAKTMDGLLNTPREALAEIPETCLSRWKKREDFFDILVDMLEGALNCLDSVSFNQSGSWSSSMIQHSQALSTAIRQVDFVIPLVILKNACAPLRNCSTVFRCGNPADIVCELEKILPIIDTLGKMLENVSVVHSTWFEEGVELAVKVAGLLSYSESVSSHDSPEAFYMATVSLPILNGLIEEMKFNFSENHLKALKVLCLLPTCNPLPILPESNDKLYTIYLSDLPEPETAEEDINNWATVWREKYQDVSPPTSISETLLHSEAKQLPNIATLLKLVAVLPSISMECDLMKTTLNSLRTLIRDGIFSRGSKTDSVMLLMHRQTLQSLEEVIEKCMEGDLETHQFLVQVKARINHLRMESEVIAMAPQEITANNSSYPQGEKDAENETNAAAAPDENAMETNGSTEIHEAEETLISTPDPHSSSTVDSSDKPTAVTRVITDGRPLLISTPEQPTESVQDATIKSTALGQDNTDKLILTGQDVNDKSKILDQCETGLLVTGYQNAANQLMVVEQDRTEQSTVEQQVSGELVSVDESEAMEVDQSENNQFVAADESSTEQSASLLNDPNQMMAVDHIEPDSSVVESQDESSHTVTRLAEYEQTGQLVLVGQSESVNPMPVDHSVNDDLASENQRETNQVMEIDRSENDQSVTADQGGIGQSETGEQGVAEKLAVCQVETDQGGIGQSETGEQGVAEQLAVCQVETDQGGIGQSETGEQGVAEQLAVCQVETDQSTVEHQNEACQIITQSGDESGIVNLISEAQIGSGQLVDLDGSGTDQNVTHVASQDTTDNVIAIGQIETDHSLGEGQSEAGHTEAGLTNESETGQLVPEDQTGPGQVTVVGYGIDQCVTADQSITNQLVQVVQVEGDHSLVETQSQVCQAEAGLANEVGTVQCVSEDQCVSDQIVVDDYEMDQSLTADQSVAQTLLAFGHVATAHCVVESDVGQAEEGVANEVVAVQVVSENQSVSDQPMRVDNGVEHCVSADQGVTDQLVAVSQVETDNFVVESQSDAGKTEAGSANEVVTGEVVSGDQSGSDQVMVVDYEMDQSVTADYIAAHQLVVLAQVETDHSVVESQYEAGQIEAGVPKIVGTGQVGLEDQIVSDQPIVVDQRIDNFVTADQGETDQLVAVGQVETDHSVVESQCEAVQTEAESVNKILTDQVVSEDQSGSDEVMVVDYKMDQSVTADYIAAHQLLAVAQVETDHSVVEGQTDAGQTEAGVANEVATGKVVSEDQNVSDQSMIVDNEIDQSVTAVHGVAHQLVSVDQVETDHSVVEGKSDAGQTETREANEIATGVVVSEVQNVSDQSMVVDYKMDQSVTADYIAAHQLLAVAQVETDHSVVEGKSDAGQTETREANEIATGVVVSEVQNVSDQSMVVDYKMDQSVTADYIAAHQLLAVAQVETDHSVVEGQSDAGQTEARVTNEVATGKVVSVDQNVSEQSMVVDNEIDQSVTANHGVAHQLVAVDQVETDHSVVEGQSDAGQTETRVANEVATGEVYSEDQNVSDQSMVVDNEIDQSVTADHSVAHLLVAVAQVETYNSVVESQSEVGPTEAGLANDVGTGQAVSEDQNGSDHLMLVDSENYQPERAGGSGHSVTGDQSVPDQFVVISQIESDQSIADGQNDAGVTETGIPNEARTGQLILGDQLMIVDSGNDQSMTADQDETGQLVTDQSVTDQYVAEDQVATPPIVEGQGEVDYSLTGLVDEGSTSQIVSEDQSGADQLMADEQSVVQTQDEISLSGTLNQSVPDQFVALSQNGTDQIVPGNSGSEFDHSQADQVGSIQSKVSVEGTDQLILTAPGGSDQETADVHAHSDQPTAISVTDHSMADSPEDITDRITAAQFEDTDQSTAKAQDSTDKVVSLDDTGPDKKVLTLYDTSAREKLLNELCDIKYFTIVAGLELQIDGQPYIPVGIHYLDKQDVQCENILAFIPLSTNITLFVDTLTISLSQKWGLNLGFCRGQTLGRPGASVSQMRQASTLLSQRLPLALGFPSPVTLQSLLTSLSSLKDIRHSFECFEQLLRWFSEDDQRQVRLYDAVVRVFQKDENKANELKTKLGSSQWAINHDILELTTDILEAIFCCLNEMKENHDTEANIAMAQSFLSAIQSFDFILTVVIMRNILSLTKNLSLQGNSYDVYQAVSSLSDVLSSLSEIKNCIDSHHQSWFQEAVALASRLQLTVQHPSLQPPLNVHYRDDISKGTVEYCIAEMEGLSQDVLSALRCLQVVPYVMSKVEGCCKDVEFVKVFQNDLPDPNSLEDELQRWRDRWQHLFVAHQHLPDTVFDTLKTSDIQSFPNIQTILRVLAALPWSSMQSSFTEGKISSELYPL
nr:uncharacterized protein si:dkey-250d21.1 isoform X2 [Misgurnus anguillicaudatus]